MRECAAGKLQFADFLNVAQFSVYLYPRIQHYTNMYLGALVRVSFIPLDLEFEIVPETMQQSPVCFDRWWTRSDCSIFLPSLFLSTLCSINGHVC